MFKKIFIAFIVIFSLVNFSYANTDLFVYKSKTFFEISKKNTRFGTFYNFEEKDTEIIFNTFNKDRVRLIQQGSVKFETEFMYLYFIDYNDDFDISNSNIFIESCYTGSKRYSQKSFTILDKDEFIEYYQYFDKKYSITPGENLDFDLEYKKVIVIWHNFSRDMLIKLTFQHYKEKE